MMLPSMPILFPLSRDSSSNLDSNQVASSTPTQSEEPVSDDVKVDCAHKSDETVRSEIIPSIAEEDAFLSFPSLPSNHGECEDELVLLAESSSFGEKRKQLPQTSNVRKKRRVDVVQPMDSKISDEELANHFAMAYFTKAKSELDDESFQKFLTILSGINDNEADVVALYNDVRDLLSHYEDLLENFIGFLNPAQASEVGKLHELIAFKQRWDFLRRLDSFHLNKACHLLEQLLSNPLIDVELVRSSFQSGFKGHPSITEGILNLLPTGKPPSFDRENYDDLSHLSVDYNLWETLCIQDSSVRCSPDKCMCVCHSHLPKKFCTICNIQFSKGQVYVRTGKGLRFAKVSFMCTDQGDVLRELNPSYYNEPVTVERKRTKSQSQKDFRIGIFTNKQEASNTKETGKTLKTSDKTDVVDSKDKQVNLNSFDSNDEFIVYEEDEDDCYSRNDLSLGCSHLPNDPCLDELKAALSIEGLGSSTISQLKENEVECEPDDSCMISHEEITDNDIKEEIDVREESNFKEVPSPNDDVAPTITSPSIDDGSIREDRLALSAMEVQESSDEICLTEENLTAQEHISIVNEVSIEHHEDLNDGLKSGIAIEVTLSGDDAKKCFEVSFSTDEKSTGVKPGKSDEDTPITVQCPKPDVDSPQEKKEQSNSETKIWTREEDKLILQAFKKPLGAEETIAEICEQLPSRTVDDVQKRFQVLMNLLEKMTSSNSDA